MESENKLPLEETGTTPPEKRKKLPALAVIGIVAGALALCCGLVCAAAALRQTVYPHTTLLGVDMGGLTAEEVTEKWESQGKAAYPEKKIALVDENGQELATVSFAQLGVCVTPKEAARSTCAAGRTDNFFGNGYRFVRSWFVPIEAQPNLMIRQTLFTKEVAELVATVNNTVVEGKAEILPEGEQPGGLYLTRPKAGRRIDENGLYSGLKAALKGGQDAVVCRFEDVTPEPLDVDAIYRDLQGEKEDARYVKESGRILPSRIGVTFDVDTVKAQLSKVKDGETVLVDAEVIFPRVTTEMLEQGLFRDVLGTYTTKVTGTAARIRNVYLAAQKIDGHIYNPGEIFRYNATVGQRTEAAGFGPAPSYVGGKTVDSIGGGICQVSSTLYYAALLSNLEIVTRYCHQFAPGYITWGCDATVSWGFPDFVFRNNTEYPIQIVTDWEDNEVTVTILGTKVDDTYVEITNAVLSSTPWETVYEVNEEMEPGSQPVEVQTPYTGYLVKTYRNIYAGDGTLISSTFEAASDYEKRDQIYEVDRQTYEKMMAEKPETEIAEE